MTLDDISENNDFRIIRLIAQGEIRKRLVDMGFISGTKGKVLRRALLNDPIELQLKGYKVSLRRSEAKQILVEDLSDNHNAERTTVINDSVDTVKESSPD